MLARVADNLYWMSRYLERADQTARLLRVQVGSLADRPTTEIAGGWKRLFRSLSTLPPGGQPAFYQEDVDENFLLADAYSLTDYMTFETDNPHSVVALWASSRENARQARQEITSEMWGHLNRYYLTLKETQLHTFWKKEPQEFFRDTSARIYLFRGVTDNSLRHGLAWDFIRLGRFMERVQVTAEILDAHLPGLSGDGEHIDWALLLRSCASFEPFCKHHTAVLRPDRVMEFLMYEPESPHTLRFAAEEIRNGLHRIDPAGGARHPLHPAHRLAGKLRALLAYSPGRDESDLAETLGEVRGLSRDLHEEIYSRYIYYTADQVLQFA